MTNLTEPNEREVELALDIAANEGNMAESIKDIIAYRAEIEAAAEQRGYERGREKQSEKDERTVEITFPTQKEAMQFKAMVDAGLSAIERNEQGDT